jgi:hypothetical protein
MLKRLQEEAYAYAQRAQSRPPVLPPAEENRRAPDLSYVQVEASSIRHPKRCRSRQESTILRYIAESQVTTWESEFRDGVGTPRTEKVTLWQTEVGVLTAER